MELTEMVNPICTVVICTRDRAEHLRGTLAGLEACRVPDGIPTELLIVDNGSRDHTQDVAEAAVWGEVAVRYVREERAGQCFARNRALAEGRGRIFLFTDDDVRVPRDWIEGMCRPILAGEADLVAGGVEFAPHFAGCDRTFAVWLASTHDLDPVNPERVVGANMAFSRRVLERVPAFDVELGPGALGFADETLFAWQAREAGLRIAGRLDVKVEHHFEPNRLSRKAIVETGRKVGRCDAYLAWHWFHFDMPMSRLGDWKRVIMLGWKMLTRPQDWLWGTKAAPWQVHLLRELAYRRQYRQERMRARNYALRGLVKVAGLNPGEPARETIAMQAA